MWRPSLRINVSKLAALLAVLSLGLALLPNLPSVELCCITSGGERPACCPPPQKEGDPTPKAQSLCCQHVALDALVAASLLTGRPSLELSRVDVALNTFSALVLYHEPSHSPLTIKVTGNLQTGPPPDQPIFLRKQSLLLRSSQRLSLRDSALSLP